MKQQETCGKPLGLIIRHLVSHYYFEKCFKNLYNAMFQEIKKELVNGFIKSSLLRFSV